MSDQLKQFIDDNREDFDSAEPSPQLLKKIKRELNGDDNKAKVFAWPLLKVAAAFAAIVLLTVTVYLLLAQKKEKKDVARIDPVIEEVAASTDPMYAKQIQHFQEVIDLQQSELKKLEKDYPDLYKQFVGDITELDSSYQSLKSNLSSNINRETLLEAMIQNLQLQSNLLNRQLQIIKEVKQKNKPYDPKS